MKQHITGPPPTDYESKPQMRRQRLLFSMAWSSLLALVILTPFLALTKPETFWKIAAAPMILTTLALGLILLLIRGGNLALSKHLMLFIMLMAIWTPMAIHPQILDKSMVPLVFTSLILMYASMFYGFAMTLLITIGQVIGGVLLLRHHSGFQIPGLDLVMIFYFITAIYAVISRSLVHEDHTQIDLQSYELGIANRELLHKEKELYHLAYYDSLTGLGSPHKFREDCARRVEEKAIFALVNIDIDNFSFINETLGHHVGDTLLRNFSHTAMQTVKSDEIYRWSEDEFLIILRTNDRHAIVQQIQRMQHAMERCTQAQHYHMPCTLSAGISLHPADGADPERLLQAANLALDQAKRNGRNRIHFYSRLLQRQFDKIYTVQRYIDQSLRLDAFELYLQPIHRIEDGNIQSAEVLLRAPEIAFTLNEIISIAEMTHQIIEVDRWVLHQTFHLLHENPNLFQGLMISINLSTQTLYSPVMLDYLESLWDRHAIDCRRIELEITEHSLIQNFDSALATLDRLRKMGFRIALDDFGTRYSSLNYLSKFPLDVLKIDKSYIENLADRIEDQTIVRHLISLSAELGLETIAEGIETLAQKNILQRMGCPFGQGYWFSMPMPLEDFRRRLEQTKEKGGAVIHEFPSL